METKPTDVRSKSSSTGVIGLSDRRRTSVTADFQKALVKKRGVYVEKKITKYRVDDDSSPKRDAAKPPPRPRPGNKKFLSSVLSILSKDTTGTQFPESSTAEQKKDKRKQARRKTELIDNKKKSKFRSRALNNAVGEDIKDNQIIVLQAQNQILNTPSNYSENDSINRSNVSSVIKKSQDKNLEAKCDEKLSDAANSLVKQVMEGKQLKNEKRVRIDEPDTLVGEINDKPALEKNKDVYNFFVDLLETTISSCNVKAECEKPTEPAMGASNAPSATKVPLEIDEAVAKKLNIPCSCPEKRIPEESCCSGENRFYCFNNDIDLVGDMCTPTPTAGAYVQKAKQLKAKSFSFVPKPKPKPKLLTESFLNKKTITGKKLKKQALINLFKEQLNMDDDAFDEPQNLYEALKMIADSKRRCRQSIQFDEIRDLSQDYNFPEHRGRTNKKGNRKVKAMKNQMGIKELSVTSSYQKKNYNLKNLNYNNEYESSYSLQVLGFEYEKPAVKNKLAKRRKEIVFAFHSSPSGSDVEDFDREDSMGNLYGEFNKSSSRIWTH